MFPFALPGSDTCPESVSLRTRCLVRLFSLGSVSPPTSPAGFIRGPNLSCASTVSVTASPPREPPPSSGTGPTDSCTSCVGSLGVRACTGGVTTGGCPVCLVPPASPVLTFPPTCEPLLPYSLIQPTLLGSVSGGNAARVPECLIGPSSRRLDAEGLVPLLDGPAPRAK